MKLEAFKNLVPIRNRRRFKRRRFGATPEFLQKSNSLQMEVFKRKSQLLTSLLMKITIA